MSHLEEGLVEKFTITRNDTGGEVGGAFVLLPETDPLAAAALIFYADLVHKENPQSLLIGEVDDWLRSIDAPIGPTRGIMGDTTMWDVAAEKYNRLIDGICPDGCL